MKIKTLLLCLLFSVSCKTVENNTKKRKKFTPLDKVEIYEEMKGYYLSVPDTWYSYIESHGMFWQSPKELKKQEVIYYANHFSVKIREVEEQINLDTIYKEKEKWLTRVYDDYSISKESYKNKEYGDYIIIKYGFIWNKVSYTVSEVVYLYNRKSYVLQYSSWNKYYSKYLPDVLKMIESFKITE